MPPCFGDDIASVKASTSPWRLYPLTCMNIGGPNNPGFIPISSGKAAKLLPAPMVNRVLTSPYLWLIRFQPNGCGPIGGLKNAGAFIYGNDRSIPRATERRPSGSRTFAVCADGGAVGPL